MTLGLGNIRAVFLSVTLVLLTLTGCSLFNPPPSVHKPASTPNCSFDPLYCLRHSPSPLGWVVGTRGGAHGAAPENSIAALKYSLLHGIRYLEVDVRRGADDTIFLYRAPRLESGAIRNLSNLENQPTEVLASAELRELVLRGGSSHIPLLTEAVAAVAPRSGVLFLDIKGPNPTKTIDVIIQILTRRDIARNIVIQFSQPILAPDLLKRYPQVVMIPRAYHKEDVMTLLSLRPVAIQVDLSWATQDLVRLIHKSGVKVLIKTTDGVGDSVENWRRALRLGVDIVLTDTPIEARKVIRERANRSDKSSKSKKGKAITQSANKKSSSEKKKDVSVKKR